MKIINLTPHALNIITAGGDVLTVPPSGIVARCAEVLIPVGSVNVGGLLVEMTSTSYGEVADLPQPVPDTIYVVSALVRLAVPERTDVASPGALVRDTNGKPVGCKGLSVTG